MRSTVTALLALLLSPASFAGVVYVDSAATGAADGSSWTDAHPSLRVALDLATPGDDLWVAAGTYLPGPTATEADSFFLKSGVRLYGGFAGGETALAQRDWLANPTYLSGDIGQDDVVTGWPSGWNITSSNSAHVVTALGVDDSAALDGFLIRGGHTGPSGTPAGSSEMFGGGIYSIGSDLTVRNCTFEYNASAFAWGGAYYNLDGSPLIEGCTFRFNATHLGSGAGIANVGVSGPVIRDCLFEGNQATTGAGGQEAQGAAISNSWNVLPITIERCEFVNNTAKQFYASGAGVEQARGGAISNFNDGLVVKECVFRGNVANAGGALFTWAPALVLNCEFTGNRVYNMIQSGFTISGYGSAIGTWVHADEETRISGCTLVGNQVVGGETAAVYGGGLGTTWLVNSVLQGNTAPPPAAPWQAHFAGNVELRFDCVDGLFTPDANEPPPPPAEVPGCIDADPLFVDAPNGDLHLTVGSPCIDAGSNELVPGVGNTDLDGLDRVAQGASSFTVDMGAYEFGSAAPGSCPQFVVQPQALAVTEGLNASFAVLALGADLTYAWRKDGAPLADGASVLGTSTPELRLLGVTQASAGNYDVVVTGDCGPVTSQAAALTVGAAPLGVVRCSGDGTDPGCPCGNDKDEGEGCENSTGDGARLVGAGSSSIAAADAALTVDRCPSNVSGILFMGGNVLNGGVGNWFGDGLLCTTPIKRFGVQNSGSTGTLTLLDPAALAPSQISPGATRVFQAWYRDVSGPCGSGWNTSNGYQVTFTP